MTEDSVYLDQVSLAIRAACQERATLPDEPNLDRLFRVYAVLALACGTELRAEDVHNAWVAWMLDEDPLHPSLVPFARLDSETRASDEPFLEAIKAVAHALQDPNADERI